MRFRESRQEIAATIKEQTDIVKIIGEHVDLKRSGIRYLGLCPFHGEKTPSFSVHGAQQFFYCFGCGESGDVYSFLMKYHNMDFPASLKLLAERLNIELPEKSMSSLDKKREEEQQRMFEVTAKAAAVYHRYLIEGAAGGVGRDYLAQRGIPESIQLQFKIGYAPSKEKAGWEFLSKQLSVKESQDAEKVGLLVKNEKGGRYDRFRDRILFPLFDGRGRICGFGGRIIGDGQPKYMNSPESTIFTKSRILMGLHQQGDEIRRRRQAIIVEGNFDMVSLVVHGCPNVVAPLGTALTATQIRLLGRYAEEAVLLFDGDEAGLKAAMRSAPFFLSEKLSAKVALLPKGHDPDTFVREKGIQQLQSLVDEAEELSEFVLAQLILKHGLTLEGKGKIAEELKPLMGAATSSLQQSVIVSHFAEKLGIDPRQLHSLVAQEVGMKIPDKPNQNIPREKEQRKNGRLNAAQRRLVEFMVMNPHFFTKLDNNNLREALAESLGEIIYLQVKVLVERGEDVQPEDILSALPEGVEKKMIADMLLNAAQYEPVQRDEEMSNHELQELLEWLELTQMRKLSRQLDEKIMEAQENNNFSALQEILLEKQQLEKNMRERRES